MVVSPNRGLQYRPPNTIIFNKESLEAVDDTSKPKKKVSVRMLEVDHYFFWQVMPAHALHL